MPYIGNLKECFISVLIAHTSKTSLDEKKHQKPSVPKTKRNEQAAEG